MADYSKGYGKRPLWQWIIIYLIIGGIIYAGIYYFVISKKGSGNLYGGTSTPTYQTPTSMPANQPSSTPSTQTAPGY